MPIMAVIYGSSPWWVGNPLGRRQVHDVFRRWRTVADAYDGGRVFVAEAVVAAQAVEQLRPDRCTAPSAFRT
jgi:hypothetical protein